MKDLMMIDIKNINDEKDDDINNESTLGSITSENEKNYKEKKNIENDEEARKITIRI